MSICVNFWAPNQVEWPRPIRSELHVESLKRPKHAVHNEWLGTLLMTRIKRIFTVHRPHGYAVGCGVLYYTWLALQIYKISLYNKHTRYVVTYNTNSPYRYIIIYQV